MVRQLYRLYFLHSTKFLQDNREHQQEREFWLFFRLYLFQYAVTRMSRFFCPQAGTMDTDKCAVDTAILQICRF